MTTATHTHTSESLLVSIAQHERDLLAKLEASRDAAKTAVEQARTEARAHLHQEETRLNADVSQIRRDREQKRQDGFNQTVGAAEQRLSGVRDEARRKVDGVVAEVTALFMPVSSGGRGQ